MSTQITILPAVEPQTTQLALRSKALELAEGAMHITVTDPSSHTHAWDALKAVKIFQKDWEDNKRPEVDDLFRVYKVSLKELQAVETPLMLAEKYLKTTIQRYEDEQTAIARREQQRLQAELDEKTRNESIEAARANQLDAITTALAEGDVARAEQIMEAPVQPAGPVFAGAVTIQPGFEKQEGTSRRGKVIIEVRNAAKQLVYSSDKDAGNGSNGKPLHKAEIRRSAQYHQIPDAFWVLDTAALQDQAKATQELTDIPGVTVRLGSTMAVRV